MYMNLTVSKMYTYLTVNKIYMYNVLDYKQNVHVLTEQNVHEFDYKQNVHGFDCKQFMFWRYILTLNTQKNFDNSLLVFVSSILYYLSVSNVSVLFLCLLYWWSQCLSVRITVLKYSKNLIPCVDFRNMKLLLQNHFKFRVKWKFKRKKYVSSVHVFWFCSINLHF